MIMATLDLSIFEKLSLANQWAGNCFGCSPTNPHGFHLHFWFEKEESWSKCEIPGNYCGFDGIAHGGIVATLLDEIAAWALGFYFESFGFTTTAQIKYLKPVPTANELILHGVISSKDKLKPKTTAYLYNPKGVLLAECESEWMIPTIEQLAYITKVEKGKLESLINPMLKSIHEFKAGSK